MVETKRNIVIYSLSWGIRAATPGHCWVVAGGDAAWARRPTPFRIVGKTGMTVNDPYENGRPDTCLSLVRDDPAAGDRQLDVQHVPVSVKRIAVQDDDVGQFAGFERSEPVAHLDVGRGV